ncbi:hypothetical protein BDB01DRAFT_839443 [Pilobolus umbonatus]|nr:hypothetical protein BDB01DRAFT_839443 [Pilobolus umbonatus]
MVEQEMREKLVAYLTTKMGQWEVRHVLMKHVLTLLHAQFAPFEYELERMLQLEQLLSLVGDKPFLCERRRIRNTDSRVNTAHRTKSRCGHTYKKQVWCIHFHLLYAKLVRN